MKLQTTTFDFRFAALNKLKYVQIFLGFSMVLIHHVNNLLARKEPKNEVQIVTWQRNLHS
jgi:hypothetical protein